MRRHTRKKDTKSSDRVPVDYQAHEPPSHVFLDRTIERYHIENLPVIEVSELPAADGSDRTYVEIIVRYL